MLLWFEKNYDVNLTLSNLAIFLSSFLALHDYIINSSTIREYNFAMETILVKGFAQALVHTVHSTRAFGTRDINSVMSKIISQNCPHGEIRHSSRAL